MTSVMTPRRVCRRAGLPPTAPHGRRSAASALLNEWGWPPDAIQRRRSRAPGGVRAVYHYVQYMDIRRGMTRWRADFLDALRDEANIPELPRE